MNKQLENYKTVAERLQAFDEDHENGQRVAQFFN